MAEKPKPVIYVDIFEPQEDKAKGIIGAKKGLEKWSVDVEIKNMVPTGFADYTWFGNEITTFEHKKADQMLAELGGRLDEQLNKHAGHAERVGLITDGIITPNPQGGCDLWQRSKDGRFFVKTRIHHTGYEQYMAYVWSITREGVEYINVPDEYSLYLALATFAHNSHKPSHDTFRKHIKKRPNTFETDPHIETLMGVGDAKVGEINAQKLLEHFRTPFRVFTAQPEDGMDVVGQAMWRRIMKGIGREISA